MAKPDWNPFEDWVDAVLRTIVLTQGCQVDVAPGKVAQFIVTPPQEAPFAVRFVKGPAPDQVSAEPVQVFGHLMPSVLVWWTDQPDRVALEAPLADRVLAHWRGVARRLTPRVIPVIPTEGASHDFL